MKKRKILVIIGHYLPGYKDGGPVRSIKNMIDRLGKEYEFYVLTTDRDAGDSKPYDQITYGEWNTVGDAKVYYAKPGEMKRKLIASLAKTMDVIYLGGCFNRYAWETLVAAKKVLFRAPVIIAAFGLFTPGAFHIKYAKKKTYMTVLRALGLLDRVAWSATSAEEAEDIRREAGANAVCYLAEDLPRLSRPVEHAVSSEAGMLRVIFLSRISLKKNLVMAAQILQQCTKGKIQFDIYGNQEDPTYWETCKAELEKLPANVSWNYCGIADAESVPETFAKYDVFLFPTMAENFGHVILEALSGGCVPIISDRTPWTDEKLSYAGKVIPLEQNETFVEAIETYCAMSIAQKKEASMAALACAAAYSATDAERAYREMFDHI